MSILHCESREIGLFTKRNWREETFSSEWRDHLELRNVGDTCDWNRRN